MLDSKLNITIGPYEICEEAIFGYKELQEHHSAMEETKPDIIGLLIAELSNHQGLDLFSELVDVISADRFVISSESCDFLGAAPVFPSRMDKRIYMDGVSGSQFTQVLNIELDQIIEASKFLDGKWSPKFTVIVAQENHHTRFFQSGHPENVPPGHIVTYRLSCSNDEIGFSANDLHELVHFLSSVYKRSTTAVSVALERFILCDLVVAPICRTCLVVAHMSQFIKFNEMFDTSFSHDGEHL
ncbi:hypothetical protein WN944_006859 [Citrus x changshan-huyou]|uniref:Piwi domain-containing protein n=1 Tax=Citrus x changshan-huyou TaxID=2935761 RepID=A0AAP0QU84_9ROSI